MPRHRSMSRRIRGGVEEEGTVPDLPREGPEGQVAKAPNAPPEDEAPRPKTFAERRGGRKTRKSKKASRKTRKYSLRR